MERKLHYSAIIPKTTFYSSNGTGRDSYIVVDSGGHIKPGNTHLPTLHPVAAGGGFTYKEHKAFYSIRKNNNITHYKSDGSGRDKYILVNEGGLSTPFADRNHTEIMFESSLRNYNKLGHSIDNLRDYFREAQRCKTPKELSQQRLLRTRQMELTMRLTTPRQKQRSREYGKRLME